MPIPSTPLVVQLTKQIDKEISAFSEQLNLRYLPADPETLSILTEKFRERFQTNGITLTMGDPDYWGRVKLGIQLDDKFILRRLRDVNVDEYVKVTCWMRMKGFEVPELDDGPLPYAASASASEFKVYGAEDIDPVKDMANQILQAEGERQRFLRSQGFMCDRLNETTPEEQKSIDIKIFGSDTPASPESSALKASGTDGITIFGDKLLSRQSESHIYGAVPIVFESETPECPSWMKTF